jgi:urate oxidase
MASALKHIDYGKSRVRVAKIVRGEGRHDFHELTVDVRLQGDFEECYMSGDNSRVIATDTMKNTVYAIAAGHGLDPVEGFAGAIGEHFLATYADVRSARIDIVEHRWDRLDPYTFEQGRTIRIASAAVSRDGVELQSGIDNLTLLKTTKSAFTGFLKDRYTTLKETTDRILATSLKATWRYGTTDVDYNSVMASCRRLLVEEFAAHESLAVQQTLYAMGDRVLRRHEEIAEISLAMPNKHYLPVNLEPLGLENRNEIFLPTDEPHGQIEACIVR